MYHILWPHAIEKHWAIAQCLGSGTPEGIRIPDLPLRRRTLYPAELLGHIHPVLYWKFRDVSTEKAFDRRKHPEKSCFPLYITGKLDYNISAKESIRNEGYPL